MSRLLDRRRFLHSASAMAALAATRTAWPSVPGQPPELGVQLFTVRKQVATDLPGTLAAIRKIGYRRVETFAAMYRRPAAELRRAIADADLHCSSAHFNYLTLEADLEYARDLGVTYAISAMLPKTLWNPDGFHTAAARFNVLGAKAKSMGLKLAFHNHNFEMKPIPASGEAVATNGLEILLKETDPALVYWEEDCYWVTQGGGNALAMLQKHSARIVALHLKDRRPDAAVNYTPENDPQFFTEVGAGTIAWQPILNFAVAHQDLLYVEQDFTPGTPLDSLAVSYRNLEKYLA